jgi:hypothetical protein
MCEQSKRCLSPSLRRSAAGSIVTGTMMYSINSDRGVFEYNGVLVKWFIACRLVDISSFCSYESASYDAKVLNDLMLSQFDIVESDSLIEH